jgi:aminoglycoside phosphotransferase family enzyme/predicted kinase
MRENSDSDSQAGVLTALSNAAMHGGDAVRRIDTHAASVFLAGGRAIKVKRAVKFPFLDYSTLERRKAACEAEIAVNRPSAPQIYRGVVAITKAPDGSFRIGGDGTPVEWAVDMRRFDEDATLDNLAERGRIDAKLAEKLAQAVFAAHAKAPQAESAPWLEAFGSYIEQNDAAFRAEPKLFPPADVATVTAATRQAFERNRPLLLKRGAAGFIRRLHGDLHLGNIALLDDQPVLFDAIEFDPLVATGDVLYDLAFLIMDLTERGLRPAANIVLNRYLQASNEPAHFDALAALPLFLSMRAAIRAKVTAARRDAAASAGRPAIEVSARKYFSFALEIMRPQRPLLLAVGGLSGTGKSVLARALAPYLGVAPGAIVLRTDVERKAIFGVDELSPLPKDAYTLAVTERVYGSLAHKAGRIIVTGFCAIVDAVFADARERSEIAKIAEDKHVAFRGLFLTAGLDTRLARAAQRTADASDADRAVVLQQAAYDLGKMDWPTLDACGTPEQTLAAARHILAAEIE